MSEIMVSVIMPTYNHEHYIEQAVRSVLMQKVNFEYEVLIGEDCSTDHTKTVLMDMESLLPQNFHIFYRCPNMGGRGKNNSRDLHMRASGRYVITLEGDDYWIYDHKLQEEVDFLEAHPEFVAVAHNTWVVDHDSNERDDYRYPECKNAEYTVHDYERGILAGQTATILFRRAIYESVVYQMIRDIPGEYPGDRRTNFLLPCIGKVRCIQEKWSAYRYVTNTGSSYSARMSHMVTYSKEYIDMFHDTLLFHRELLAITRREFADNIDAIQCIEAKYMWHLLRDIRKRTEQDSTWENWFREFRRLNSKTHTIGYIGMEICHYIATRIKRQHIA